MKLMDVFLKMSGGAAAEKTAAAAGTDEVDALIASLGLKDQVKTAEDREVVKLANSYMQMGVEIARQTFVSEVIGGGEKTAEEIEAEKKAASEKTKTEEPAAVKTAAEKTSGDADVEKLMAEIGLIEKPSAEKTAAADADKAAAELKAGALQELVAVHLVPAAKTGSVKATEALKKIASSSPKGRELITEAVKNGAAMGEKSKGSLAKYMAMKNGKVEKK